MSDVEKLREKIAIHLTEEHGDYHSDWPADMLTAVLEKIADTSGNRAVLEVIALASKAYSETPDEAKP